MINHRLWSLFLELVDHHLPIKLLKQKNTLKEFINNRCQEVKWNFRRIPKILQGNASLAV